MEYGPPGRFLTRYVNCRAAKKTYPVHRLVAWAFLGKCPEGKEIDHINRIRNDNRPENLRWLTRQENNWNSYAKGVYTHRGRWRTQVVCDHKVYHLGIYDTPEEAEGVFRKAREALMSGVPGEELRDHLGLHIKTRPPSKTPGAYRKRGKWAAMAHHQGKSFSLGSYDTPEAAQQVYLQAKALLTQGIPGPSLRAHLGIPSRTPQ